MIFNYLLGIAVVFFAKTRKKINERLYHVGKVYFMFLNKLSLTLEVSWKGLFKAHRTAHSLRLLAS